MDGHMINEAEIDAYAEQLRQQEHAAGTVAKYIRDLRALAQYLDGGAVTQESVGRWRDSLLSHGYAPATINSMLAAVNGFCGFLRLPVRVRFLKVQRQIFRDVARTMTRGDYEKLVSTAEESGQKRLALLMQALCATGVRVSELRYITVESARRGRATIALKGKIRTLLIPKKLAGKLLGYAKAEGIAAGAVFRTRSGRAISRRQVWIELKRLCKVAGVAASCVFPHNFRHLFAVTFYAATKDIVKLADVLGHSSIETTRIYLISTGQEHERQLERLGLIL